MQHNTRSYRGICPNTYHIFIRPYSVAAPLLVQTNTNHQRKMPKTGHLLQGIQTEMQNLTEHRITVNSKWRSRWINPKINPYRGTPNPSGNYLCHYKTEKKIPQASRHLVVFCDRMEKWVLLNARIASTKDDPLSAVELWLVRACASAVGWSTLVLIREKWVLIWCVDV